MTSPARGTCPSQPPLRTRPLTPEDRALLAAFPGRVSSASAFARFHGAVNALSEKTLDRLLALDPGGHEAIIAEDEGGIAAVARYARDPAAPSIADLAVIVADDLQRRGVARTLLQQLANRARDSGIDTFRANVLLTNTAARRLVEGVWPVTAEERIDGEIVYLLQLTPWPPPTEVSQSSSSPDQGSIPAPPQWTEAEDDSTNFRPIGEHQTGSGDSRSDTPRGVRNGGRL